MEIGNSDDPHQMTIGTVEVSDEVIIIHSNVDTSCTVLTDLLRTYFSVGKHTEY